MFCIIVAEDEEEKGSLCKKLVKFGRSCPEIVYLQVCGKVKRNPKPTSKEDCGSGRRGRRKKCAGRSNFRLEAGLREINQVERQVECVHRGHDSPPSSGRST